MDVISKGKRGQNMFTRSSNWTKDEKTNKMCARYMIGNNIKASGVTCIEFKEFLVSLDFHDVNNIDAKLIQIKYLNFNE
jgi:hypothetical protein